MEKKKKIVQITSGKGPVECCRVVALVQDLLLQHANQLGIDVQVLDNKAAALNGTLLSATLMITGNNLDAFVAEWTGTIQWIAPSPYRKNHKRKNWFVGIAAFDEKELMSFHLKDVRLETCRASGPGGQHVNKVETAVRGTHVPSGLQVLAMDARSQIENKQLCLTRLQAKIVVWQTAQLMEQAQSKWMEHLALERGNPIKVIQRAL